MAVDDSLICDDLHCDVFSFHKIIIGIDCSFSEFHAKGDKNRSGTEIIKMMMNRFDAEGTQVGNEKAGVEGA